MPNNHKLEYLHSLFGAIIIMGDFSMIRFFLWMFSHRSEKERIHSNDKHKIILHDFAVFAFLFGIAILLSVTLSHLHDDNNQFSVPVFILVVSLIARFTTGYAYGIAASVLGVFCVNYMFTYPYWEFDMTIAGYPLTFAAMLMVSICISTLTSQIKKHERLRMEAEMEKLRANLLRSISHDLRTPLTSIVGSSSLLLESNALEQTQRNELLAEIHKDARWLTRITENILSITKFSGTSVHLHKEHEVIEEIVSSAIVKSRKNHPDIPVYVKKPDEILLAPMDGMLIEQVLLNLLDNAVVHGKHVSTIEVHIFKEHERIHIRVSDDGCGIQSSLFPHLFDGYVSAYKENTDDTRSMGIGLSVCRSIVQAHNGEINAYNNENGGASFEFWLPSEEVEEYEPVQR